jgi:exonuclease III
VSTEDDLLPPDHCGEGRLMAVEYRDFFVLNAYVPNAGMALKRLDYRVGQGEFAGRKGWDPALRDCLNALQTGADPLAVHAAGAAPAGVLTPAAGKPVLLVGDLNCAHGREDMYNPDAAHIERVPGCTPQERRSFHDRLLAGAGLVDTFRLLHPPESAPGCFSYWSARTRARDGNRGLRIDYALASRQLCQGNGAVVVRDAYILDEATRGVSDHCPVGVDLDIGA